MAETGNTKCSFRGYKGLAGSILCAVLVLLACVISAAEQPAENFHVRWKGTPDGGSCYFEISHIVEGNFLQWKGEEIAIIDSHGYAHIIEWENNSLITRIITDDPIELENVREVIAADLDGGGLDFLASMDASGTIALSGNEEQQFQPMCSGCLAEDVPGGMELTGLAAADFDGDDSEELVSVASVDDVQLLVFFHWNGDSLELLTARELDPQPENSRIENIFPATAGDIVSEYYLVRELEGFQRELVLVEVDEEGAFEIEKYALSDYAPVVSGLTVVEGEGGRSEILAAGSFGGDPGLLLLKPGSPEESKLLGAVPAGAGFHLKADLNGDGKREIFFADYDCGFTIMGRPGARVLVDNLSAGRIEDLKILSGNRVFFPASFLRGATLTDGDGYSTVSLRERKLLLDHSKNQAYAIEKGSEEPVEVDVEFIREPGGLYVSPAAAEPLNFECDWDMITGTLNIKLRGGRIW